MRQAELDAVGTAQQLESCGVDLDKVGEMSCGAIEARHSPGQQAANWIGVLGKYI